MAEREKNLPPRIYHENDPDGIFILWKDMVAQVVDDERAQAILLSSVVDPDLTPEQYLPLMLASLGNPFVSVYLTTAQKRKVVKLLIPMYQQKGIKKGIKNAVRVLTGIEVEIIDPHADADDGWQVGVSEIGYSTYVGGERIYTNELNWSEDFEQADWTLTDATVDDNSTTGPSPWGRDADTFDMSTAGARFEQTVTPLETAGEDFTCSIWLKAASAGTMTIGIVSVDFPSDEGTSDVSVTTDWQRFDLTHTMAEGTTGDVTFFVESAAGFAPDLYAWGAQLVRHDQKQPYVRTTTDGQDSDKVGSWAYHFFIQSPVTLTENQETIIRMIADFVKPAHTHYDIIQPEDLGFIDHWEVGISLVGETTYVHA